MTPDYWSIDIPGLSHEQAVRLRDALQPEAPLGVLLLDPSQVMVRGFDRSSVELMATCLEAGIVAADLPHIDRMGAMSLLEDWRAWLAETAT